MSALGELGATIVQGLIELTITLVQSASRPFQFVFSRRYRAQVRQRWAADRIRGAVELLGGTVVVIAFLGLAYWWSLVLTSGSKMQSHPDDARRAHREAQLRSVLEKVTQYKEHREPLSELEARYNAALAHGLGAILFASQFDTLFPKSKHFISYFSGEAAKPIWNSKAGLYGRYVLTMQIPLTIDRATNKVTANGEPTFHLNEVTSITRLPDGRASIRYDGVHFQFGADDWRLLFEHRGDLSIFGIHPKTNSPVNDFQATWEGA